MKEIISSNDKIIHVNKNGLEYIRFENFGRYDNIVTHCFSTRNGGVSSDECSSLNLGFNRRDTRKNVEENFKRLSLALGFDCNDMVFSNQVHDCRIKVVGEDDRGKGIVRENDIVGFDGLITSASKVVLVTFYADCVPVMFLDPVKKVVGSAHSGWRGTVKEIAREMVFVMQQEFECNSRDIEVAIGPSIGKCCFEVGEEVYEEFSKRFDEVDVFCKKSGETKWHIDLQGIIKNTLTNAGVLPENILISGLCTKCNNDMFFSYRGDNGSTGSLAAFIQINQR